jgi:regulator of protease activity HflC (stomatin/prohibitin superfamily)
MTGIFEIFGVLAIIYGILGFIFKIVNKNNVRNPVKLPAYVPALVAGLLITIAFSMVIKVGAQEVGVLITPTGVSPTSLKTGWHFVMPWNDIKFMDRTEWVYSFTHNPEEGAVKKADAIWAPTSDGIKMGFDLSVTWKIDPDYASWIYANISDMDGSPDGRYKWIEDNVIRAKAKSGLALTVSQYNPIECYSNKREEIQTKTYDRLKKEFDDLHLILMQVDLREVFYNPEYETAINQKKLAEQEALRLFEVTKQKEEQLKQARIDKDIVIEKAKGESEALKIKGQSITSNPQIINLEWINKWNGQLPTIMSGNGAGILLNMENLKGISK